MTWPAVVVLAVTGWSLVLLVVLGTIRAATSGQASVRREENAQREDGPPEADQPLEIEADEGWPASERPAAAAPRLTLGHEVGEETAREAREANYSSRVLQRLAEQAARIAGLVEVRILVLDPTDPRAVTLAVGLGQPEGGHARQPTADEGLVGEVLRVGRPQLVARRRRDGEDAGAVCVPLYWGGAVRGALLGVGSRAHGRLGVAALAELEAIAPLAAAALHDRGAGEPLEAALGTGAEALVAALELRDRRLGRLSSQLGPFARQVGERLGLDGVALVEVELAGRLSDVGLIGVPDAVFTWPVGLDEPERAALRRHPVWSAEIISHVPGLEVVATVARHHHERWDGSGYPDGLEGERIPLASRIVGACQAYAAMRSDRPYRDALDHEEAIRQLVAEEGSGFDSRVVAALTRVASDGQIALGVVAGVDATGS
jgi:HD-GYP domain-containing protein (c-di-GMP phosphodiesterase class II)